MSDSSHSLPPKPSLEQLRKQAKELAESASLTLMQAQRELAKRYGFADWAALAAHVAAVNPPGLKRYEELARALATAYAAGDVRAVRTINWTYGTSFVWDKDAELMKRRLPAWFASAERDPELAVADARHLVARSVGFDDWPTLARSLGAAPAARSSTAELQPYRFDAATNTITVAGRLADAHWDAVIAAMKDRGITGVIAPGMTDAVLKRVSRVDGLRRLSVGGAVTDAGIRHLENAGALEDLELNGAHRVSDGGLVMLRKLKRLKRFQMCWARGLSDDGVANLALCDALEEVDLMGTATGDGAINALTDKPSLQRFRSGRLVTDRGVALFPRFPAFREVRGDESKMDLMAFSALPTDLMLDGSFTDRGLSALVGLDGLVGLSFFWHCTALTSAALAVVRQLANLRFLGCQGALCDDTAMTHIGAAPRLRMLMGQGAIASDAGFAELARSQTLEYLWGRDCPSFGSRGFAALASMPSLKGLGISLKRVDDGALSALPSFPALRQLMPMDVTDEGFRWVGQCKQLENLWCMYCRSTGDAATEHLRGLDSLRSYYAGSTRITDRSLELLSELRALEKIELYDVQGVTDLGVAALARLPRLKELSIDSSPRVTRAAFAAFGPQVATSYS
jgi:hypothetical protein